MIKWIGAILFYFSSLSLAFATPLICPFTDYFNIESSISSDIISLSSDGNVLADKIDASHFITNCKSNASADNGHVYVTLRWPDASVCTLHILDGPYEMNPSVVFTHCFGQMIYAGIEHVWGTYHYTLKFLENE